MSLKILLADDSMTAQNMGKKILADAGYEVFAVSNGAAAVKKIAEINPHICILDIYMPGYTGLEVCERVKGAPGTARMPVLLTVGKMEPYKPEEGARVRADGVIVKPFEASELLRAVQRFAQRAAGITTGIAPPPPGAAPELDPANLPATYERTVKLTREQIREMMDPNSPRWQSATSSPESMPSVAARTEIPVEVGQAPAFAMDSAISATVTASTADTMPSFSVALAEEVPAPPLEPQEQPAMVDLASSTSAAEIPNASAALPGFVDYILAHATDAWSSSPEAALPDVDYEAEHVPVSPLAAREIAQSQSYSEKMADAQSIGYDIPSIDPALEVAPPVSIVPSADPQFEPPEDLQVDNGTEEGLQPTSRAPESAGVVSTADPNLAPMEGLMDAVAPLEGGRLTIPEPQPEPIVAETISEPAAPVEAPAPPPTKRSKKDRQMRPVAAQSATGAEQVSYTSTADVDTQPAAPSKPEVAEEIAAFLNMLNQSRGTTRSHLDPQAATHDVASDAIPAYVAGAARVWMAEEVALTDPDYLISLENEMRVAYAAMIPPPDEVPVQFKEAGSWSTRSFTRAEDTVRDDKNAPQPAMPDPGNPSPGAGASPTQDLAAAMAAAFGGALPKEDLARAEETQSISEEVRRFALGDAYKPKTGFGGAAIDDPEEPVINKARLSAAIGRALDRLKPQIVAEILKELQTIKEE